MQSIIIQCVVVAFYMSFMASRLCLPSIVACTTREFSNWTAFQTWKEAEEENNYIHFVKPTGIKSSSNLVVLYTYIGDSA